MKKKALLFINGEAPFQLPKVLGYQVIACADGAFSYLETMAFPLDLLDFISGDLDSFPPQKKQELQHKIIETQDQNKTDLHKALEILAKKGVTEVDVYGASGKEQDHFLGNLTTILQFQSFMDIICFDNYNRYFFAKTHEKLKGVKGKTISLFPFPVAKNIQTQGLKWPLNTEDLSMLSRIGTRNLAQDDEVDIRFDEGYLLIFIQN